MNSKEGKTHENSPPAMPILPDGVGLDLQEVEKLLREKSKTIVSADDPIMMLVPLLNAFLTEESKLMERHKEALIHILAAKTDKFVTSVEHVTTGLSQTLSTSTLDAMKNTFSEHNKVLTEHKTNIRWLSTIAAVSALVNVAVFVLSGL